MCIYAHISIYMYVYMHGCLVPMCAASVRPKEGIRNGVTDHCEPPYGCWDLNSSPLEEQLVLLPPVPCLQPLTAPTAVCLWDPDRLSPCNMHPCWRYSSLSWERETKALGGSAPSASHRQWQAQAGTLVLCHSDSIPLPDLAWVWDRPC